jgi:hypothetical protein
MEAMSVLQTETLLISPSYRSIYLNDPGGWGGGEVEIPHPEPGRPYAPVMAWADPAVSPGSIYLGTASDTAKVWVTISVGEPSDIPAGAEFALSTEMEFAPAAAQRLPAAGRSRRGRPGVPNDRCRARPLHGDRPGRR